MKQKIEKYIKNWEQQCYFNGIPDEAPRELEKRDLVPSYRRICIAIMKNDTNLKSLGFTANKSIYYDNIKYNELLLRNKQIQLKLFL
jgi:predicted phosphoadenosine phosphosulfate sulfurtransferase